MIIKSRRRTASVPAVTKKQPETVTAEKEQKVEVVQKKEVRKKEPKKIVKEVESAPASIEEKEADEILKQILLDEE